MLITLRFRFIFVSNSLRNTYCWHSYCTQYIFYINTHTFASRLKDKGLWKGKLLRWGGARSPPLPRSLQRRMRWLHAELYHVEIKLLTSADWSTNNELFTILSCYFCFKKKEKTIAIFCKRTLNEEGVHS